MGTNPPLGSEGLGEFCGKFSVSPASICQIARALVLQSSTGLGYVCFSYAIISGRDAPLKGINTTIGAFLNAVICRVGGSTDCKGLCTGSVRLVGSLVHHYYTAFYAAQFRNLACLEGGTLISCQKKAAPELA